MRVKKFYHELISEKTSDELFLEFKKRLRKTGGAYTYLVQYLVKSFGEQTWQHQEGILASLLPDRVTKLHPALMERDDEFLRGYLANIVNLGIHARHLKMLNYNEFNGLLVGLGTFVLGDGFLLAAMHSGFEDCSGSTYLISDDLWDVLKDVSLKNISIKHFLENTLPSFVELPYGLDSVHGVKIESFYTAPPHLKKGLGSTMAIMSINKSPSGDIVPFLFSIHFDEFGRYDEEKTIGCNKESAIFKSNLRSLINAAVYINSGNPDLRHFKNDIKYQTPTSKTPIRGDKELSCKDIILVGFGFKKPPEWTKNQWVSSAHMGWRLTGKGRSIPKLVFVNGCIKHRSQLKTQPAQFEEDLTDHAPSEHPEIDCSDHPSPCSSAQDTGPQTNPSALGV